MRTSTRVESAPTTSLRESPRNQAIHAEFDLAGRDSWLVDDIRRNGILMPLLIGPDGTLADGHRRLAAAKLLGISHVPCLMLQATDDAAFSSAQLARNMTLFAKCALYRDRINDLLRRGQEISQSQLRSREPAMEAESEALDREWELCVEVLGVSRRSLSQGVKLLDVIDDVMAADNADGRDRGNKLLYVFRNRGLKPTLRMLDRPEPVSSDDAEPDCGDWRAADDVRPVIRKYARKSSSELREAWLTAALNYLGRFERLAMRHGVLTPSMSGALEHLRAGVSRQPLRIA